MIQNEVYNVSYRIERFLLNALGSYSSSTPSLNTRKELKGLYQFLVFYEDRGSAPMCKPSDYRNYVERFKRYFEQAIDKLSKTNSSVAKNAFYLKDSILYIESSKGFLDLYEELKSMTE
tara:strand:+ start:35314 stop:35670 length:357 start_codon:yes stop_codon:yes gene_type:complete